MTRRRKVLSAGGILLLGLVLAWPFRKSVRDAEIAPVFPEVPVDTSGAASGDPIVSRQPAAGVPVAPGPVEAHAASTNSAALPTNAARDLGGFDIANHPALLARDTGLDCEHAIPVAEPAVPAVQPAYNTVDNTRQISAQEWPAELVHVVANGDTLEKLAERYLNDPGRALEIFDLNRDQLSNPHLLPIGVELRVPLNPNRIVD